jgi:hypothetical protein
MTSPHSSLRRDEPFAKAAIEVGQVTKSSILRDGADLWMTVATAREQPASKH